ncbi:MAG: glutaminyl-peptide cyclotransferase [Chitinophagaceae bacterium]
MTKKYFFFLTTVLFVVSCSNNGNEQNNSGNDNVELSSAPPVLPYAVVNVLPHDTSSFTEGLLIHNGQLFESTGGQPSISNFKSWFGPVDIKTGKPLRKIMLDTSYFGEGIAILNGNLYQLTWEDRKGFVYDATTFKKLREFTYNGEGWALTDDGTHLIMSDGSSNLQYLDPVTLKVVKILGVTDNNGPVGNLNELEYINGYIYANQYLTSYIVKIDPSSGKVTGKMDFTALDHEVKTKLPQALEMNGIAFDSAAGKIFVTGKAWPNMYEIKFN